MAQPPVDDPILSTPAVGEYLDDPVRVLRTKVRILLWMSLVDAISYACLLVPMYMKWIQGDRSDGVHLAIRFIGFFHGMIWIAYTYMALDVGRLLRWKKEFLAFAVIPPIVGAIACHLRLRREPIPPAT